MSLFRIMGNRIAFIAGFSTLLLSVQASAVDEILLGSDFNDSRHSSSVDMWSPSASTTPSTTFGLSENTITPLVSIQFTANTNAMKGNVVELGATYTSLTLKPGLEGFSIGTRSNSLTLEASLPNGTLTSPLTKALDFSSSIREKVEAACAEKMLDKLIVDGAVGFNINW